MSKKFIQYHLTHFSYCLDLQRLEQFLVSLKEFIFVDTQAKELNGKHASALFVRLV